MEVFLSTLEQMLMMFTIIVTGFVLRRFARLPEGVDTILSRLETLVFLPALSLYTQLTRCTVETFTQNASLILIGGVIMGCAIALSYGLSALFVPRAAGDPQRMYTRNVYKYAFAYGNYGFMGNFIVLAVFGEEMFFRYSLLTLLVSILNSSWGMYILMPRGQGVSLKTQLIKAATSPMIIALAAGVVLGLTGVGKYVPGFLLNAMESAGQCQGPIAMLLAGYVVGGYDWREMLSNRKVYAATALRLIVIPAVGMIILRMLGADKELMTLALILLATPLGLNTIVYPAAFGGETKTGASMAMISHVLCVATIPLMYLLFIGRA